MFTKKGFETLNQPFRSTLVAASSYNLKTTNQNKKMIPPTIAITVMVGSTLVRVVPPMPARREAYSASPAFIISPVLLPGPRCGSHPYLPLYDKRSGGIAEDDRFETISEGKASELQPTTERDFDSP